MRADRVRRAVAAVGAAALVATGCGSEPTGGGDPTTTAAAATRAAPDRSLFPAVPASGDIEQALAQTQPGLRLALSTTELQPGRNRIGFGLFATDGAEVDAAAVALYVATRSGRAARGPFPARRESLTVEGRFRSRQTAAEDTDAVYVADVDLPRAGPFAVVAVIADSAGDRVSDALPITVQASAAGRPPRVGARAPRIHTLTPADVGGDLARLTTRDPALRSLVDTDVADVLGRRPLVLGFATPQLCQTRICGPVVDAMAQVQAGRGADVSFVQQEIYVDDEVARGLRPQLAAYRLRTEPWVFVIDRRGIIRARFEGAFSVAELDAAVARVAR